MEHALDLEHSMTSIKDNEIFRFLSLNISNVYHFVVVSPPHLLRRYLFT